MKNEITVRVKCSKSELINILKNKGFYLIDKFNVIHTYYINKNKKLNEITLNNFFKKYILLRHIKQYKGSNFKDYYDEFKITYKTKNIASNGDIIQQNKYDCKIFDINEGRKLLTALGYKELFTIKEETITYYNNRINVDIKSLEDGDILLELETNKELDTIDKLKQEIKNLDIPIDESDFFVKKAERKLKDLLGEKQ